MGKKRVAVKQEVQPVTWLTQSQIWEGRRWIVGEGPLPARTMFIVEHPSFESLDSMAPYFGPSENYVLQWAANSGINSETVYRTYAVKYIPKKKKAVGSTDQKACAPYLAEEIKRCQPTLIVAMGNSPLKMLFDNRYKISDYRGCVLDYPGVPGCKVVATYAPGYILRNPHLENIYKEDWELAGNLYRQVKMEAQFVPHQVINCWEALSALVDRLIAEKHILSIDCEWHGQTWMHADRYLRLVQLRWGPEQVAVVEFYSEGVTPEGQTWKPEYKRQEMDDPVQAIAQLKRLFTHPNISLMGHNIIADGEWLMSYGIDIRNKVVYDTMLAEYLLQELGPFDLGSLSCKYTKYGRYDLALMTWVNQHKDEIEFGYGAVPRDLIIPYAATDVEVPAIVAEKQIKDLTYAFAPRGKYPSLFRTTMDTQRNLYELELTGMLADKERLKLMAEAYTAKLVELEAKIVTVAAEKGLQGFNFRSVDQVRVLLYDKLKLTPVKTTDDKEWSEYILRLSPEEQEEAKASTDKTSLMILQRQHPAVKLMLDIKRIDQIVKTFLKEDDEATIIGRGGGLLAKIWPDGRFHSRFSQLTDTGRFRARKPNPQNWSKKAEDYMRDIFGKDKVPPALRTIVIPPPGHVIVEPDYVQAELFVLAGLSGDETMWEALTTPGKDLHDKTAFDSFGIRIFNDKGVELTEAHLVTIAKIINDDELFKDHYLPTLTYVDQKGRQLTRKQFKAGIRVSSKNINFGIPYGRGSKAIALQVLAETGTDTPLSELETQMEQGVRTWKDVTYPRAWAFMEQCAEAVTMPGYLVNPWGRLRRFCRPQSKEQLAGMEREAQNFPIQSTVADTMMIAMQLIVEYRQKHNLRFRLINQVHDALMLEVPEIELDATKEMLKNTMGNIDIPMPAGRTLRLGIDIEVMSRWSEEVK